MSRPFTFDHRIQSELASALNQKLARCQNPPSYLNDYDRNLQGAEKAELFVALMVVFCIFLKIFLAQKCIEARGPS